MAKLFIEQSALLTKTLLKVANNIKLLDENGEFEINSNTYKMVASSKKRSHYFIKNNEYLIRVSDHWGTVGKQQWELSDYNCGSDGFYAGLIELSELAESFLPFLEKNIVRKDIKFVSDLDNADQSNRYNKIYVDAMLDNSFVDNQEFDFTNQNLKEIIVEISSFYYDEIEIKTDRSGLAIPVLFGEEINSLELFDENKEYIATIYINQ